MHAGACLRADYFTPINRPTSYPPLRYYLESRGRIYGATGNGSAPCKSFARESGGASGIYDVGGANPEWERKVAAADLISESRR